MTITLRARSVDGYREVRKFKTVEGARKWAHRVVGPHPEEGSTYVVEPNFGTTTLTFEGTTYAELFPPPEKTRDVEFIWDPFSESLVPVKK